MLMMGRIAYGREGADESAQRGQSYLVPFKIFHTFKRILDVAFFFAFTGICNCIQLGLTFCCEIEYVMLLFQHCNDVVKHSKRHKNAFLLIWAFCLLIFESTGVQNIRFKTTATAVRVYVYMLRVRYSVENEYELCTCR